MTDKKQALITKVRSYLPKTDTKLQTFAALFLDPLSERSLEHIKGPELGDIIKERYANFTKHTEAKKFTTLLQKPSINAPWLENRIILELIYPDASYILVTLEALIQKYKLRVTRKLHPIIGITRTDKGKIKAIGKPERGLELISYLYITFEDPQDPDLLKAFKAETDYHMNAIQAVKNGFLGINIALDTVKHILTTTNVKSTEPKEEWINLIEWLRKLNFSFFGYIKGTLHKESLSLETESGEGLLSPPFLKKYPQIAENLQTHLKKPLETFALDTLEIPSPVQRFDNLMCLTIALPNPNGSKTIHSFLGILKRSSLQAKNIKTPLIHLKMEYIFKAKNMLPGSYNYNEVIRIFTVIPKFEIFRTSKEDLLEMVEDLLSVTNPNHVQLFIRKKNPKLLKILIIIPSHLFSQKNTQKVHALISNYFPNQKIELIPIAAEEKSRLHVYIHSNTPMEKVPSPEALETQISAKIKTWEGRVTENARQKLAVQASAALSAKYLSCIPGHYKDRTHPKDALTDLLKLDALNAENPYDFLITPFDYPPESEFAGKTSIIRVFSIAKIDLAEIMPQLQNLGVHVIDQLTARIGKNHSTHGFIQSFRVTHAITGKPIHNHPAVPQIEELLLKVFHNKTENDPLNALCLYAKLDWRALNVIQTYRNLYLQLSSSYSREKINETLLKYPDISRILFEKFNARFSINKVPTKANQGKLDAEFKTSLNLIAEIPEDTIMKRLNNLIESTLRTNFFQDNTTAIAIKLDSQKITEAPSPRPYREIYVHDVGFEATHLRFGPVSRGGLRWSDRSDDFRTEILGLVKTQTTKNVVIVPHGSKGGFITKDLFSTREATQENAQTQYKSFISSMISITDSISATNKIIPPKDVRSHDDPDPYLVVAADKGTATFSDLANSISLKKKFWLGDAFASGGSNGYDHKKVGITAKGAWECVKLHFASMGKNPEKDKLSVTGIGDMSGDVFGNGLLLSKTIQLKAAFNHIHIFLDPNPNPQKSWEERSRLFKLPRSTWLDYNPKLISKGGGVFNRYAKEIKLSPEAKNMLATTKTKLTGEELIRLILKMKTDILWFGGIGTYIKSSPETHLDADDTANDNVRIDAKDCGAKVIGEGANLGLTQDARIEYALAGGKLNSDAIDNSAGVNMSDYEVNLKILLKNNKNRNELLESATKEVTDLVLENNRAQHKLLDMEEKNAKKDPSPYLKLTKSLITQKILDPITEGISLEALEKTAFTRPVLAKLQAYVKMTHYDHLLAGPTLATKTHESQYLNYFPKSIQAKFKKEILSHRLRHEITAMLITNHTINTNGMLE